MNHHQGDRPPPPILLQPITSGEAIIAFEGRLNGQKVVWQATVIARHHPLQGGGQDGRWSLMEVHGVNNDGYATLRLSLPYSDLTAARLWQAMIMVQRWRRLTIGSHRWGESSEGADPPLPG
jgi:hypothetical protein